MANGCGINKDDFLRADPETRDSVMFDNLQYLRGDVSEVKTDVKSILDTQKKREDERDKLAERVAKEAAESTAKKTTWIAIGGVSGVWVIILAVGKILEVT